MSVGMRHFAIVGLAMALLIAGMLVPSREIALVCGAGALVCMLLAVIIVRTGVSMPLASLAAWRKRDSDTGELSSVPENLGRDFAELGAVMESSLRECAGLRAACEQERTRAETAEQAQERNREELAALREQIGKDAELRHSMADKVQTLFSLYWSLVHPLAKLVGCIAQGVEEQRFRLDETSGAMSHITDNVEHIAGSANTASEQAQGSRDVAISGARELRVAVDSIDEVKERTLTLKDAMNSLGQKA